MNLPPIWTDAELEVQRKIAIEAFRRQRMEAVSYTHLDVYKRQISR